jgi:hypothetical protein
MNELLPSLTLAGLGLLMGYSIYRDNYPTLDNLKERKRKREQPSMNVEIGLRSMELERKQTQWEERCLIANRLLEY